ncbi:Hypothetical protein DEACI_2424 [Acididesulfobacillus acetoxydans]|uniref:Uncharacterized protein n=1 Tax=Acididesulfobacillus acetoxydans TaxID=1561005 RepID=A0A8S0XBX9_9FIRM|nr:Hypothetical protein DEACI_2424 [Acididesulfobacillus acetoxydans]CEJ09025.1 Hypothetical protein DEACI_3508 [Acididesulfobacillus acetoxydans]
MKESPKGFEPQGYFGSEGFWGSKGIWGLKSTSKGFLSSGPRSLRDS